MKRALAAALALLCAAAQADVPAFDAVRASHQPSDLPLLARDGTPLSMVRVDPKVRRGPWLALADISPALRNAIVFSEDRRFWEHGGVDWRALAASAWGNAWNERTRGASTLTMQLAGLTDEELARPAGGRGVAQKVSQIRRAREFEAGWSKAQILEAYLNRVPLRGEVVGIAAASWLLFGKHASGLDMTEAAILAALVRAPNAAPAVVERRACEVLKQQHAGCDGLSLVLSQALARRPGGLPAAGGEDLAPHLAQRVARTTPAGQPLKSTLDAGLQRMALAALRRQLSELRGHNVEDGALVVLDNATGEVLAWVGSAGPLSRAAEVDAVLARRQPGSTIKPFVYALALEQRLLSAGSLIDDAPLQLSAAGALYAPQNYDHGYKGAVSVRTALASSLNVPAVRVGAMLGPEAIFDTLAAAGLRPSESAGYHGHALALGVAEVTLLDLTNAYRMLANQGRHTPPRWMPGMPAGTPRRVFEAGAAFVVADMLADPAARATTFGLDSPLVTRGYAAVKTGTSKDLRDNWCVGFSARYTVGVWVGNASGAPMQGVSGVSGAAHVWREVLAWLHAKEPSKAPAPPHGLQRAGAEWFLAGASPPRDTKALAAPFGIRSPLDGSIVVLDPDIPMAAQRLVIEGAAGRWRMDGQDLGQGTRLRWLPRPGRHVLERSDAAGVVDRVAFEVRAAPPPNPRAQPIRKPG